MQLGEMPDPCDDIVIRTSSLQEAEPQLTNGRLFHQLKRYPPAAHPPAVFPCRKCAPWLTIHCDPRPSPGQFRNLGCRDRQPQVQRGEHESIHRSILRRRGGSTRGTPTWPLSPPCLRS